LKPGHNNEPWHDANRYVYAYTQWTGNRDTWGWKKCKRNCCKRDNSTAKRKMAYFSLSYDHRIIDGALASRFLGSLAEVVENESLLKEVLKIKI
jgi:hypothetical protein